MNKRRGLHIILFFLASCSFQEMQASVAIDFNRTQIVIDTLHVDTSDISPRRFNN